jgi:hypothetical protein
VFASILSEGEDNVSNPSTKTFISKEIGGISESSEQFNKKKKNNKDS